MTSRLRVDDLAAEELNKLHEDIDGTRTGVASEALRKGVKAMREEYDIEEEQDE